MSRVDDYCPPAAPVFGGDHDLGPRASWRARGLRDHLLMYHYAGRCRIGWDGGELVSRAGDVDLIAPGVAHDYGTPPGCARWGVRWAVFAARDEWLPWLAWPGPAPGIGHVHLADPALRRRVSDAIDAAWRLAGGTQPHRDLLAMNALEAALLWCRGAVGGGDADERVRRGVGFACANLHRPIGLDAIARASGVSRPQLVRLFRRHLGTTPQRFLEDRRLQRACELLRGSALPVREVAERCGFASPFYFSTRFARRFGVGPRDWRARR